MLLRSIKNNIRNLCSFLKTYKVGDNVTVVKTINEEELQEFSRLSGDANPIHISNDTDTAIVHGAFLNSIVSGIIGTKFPGPGTLVVSQNLNFPNKCFVGDTVEIKVELVELRKLIKVNYTCEVKEERKVVMYGDAKLIMKNIL